MTADATSATSATGGAGPGGLPRVWLHGAGLSALTWDPARAVGLRPSLPGHDGRPRAPEASASAYADPLLPDLPDRFVLIGHSLGGMIAQNIAARCPERVAALVLAETAYTMRARRIDRLGARLAVWLTRLLGPRGTAWLAARGQGKATQREYRLRMAAMDPDGLTDAMAAAHDFDGSAGLARLAMPVLILVGRKNPRSLPQARAMQRALPQARLEVLEAGHMLHTDAPAAFYGAVDRFVAAQAA